MINTNKMIGIIVLSIGIGVSLWLLSVPNVSSPSTKDYYEKHYKYGKFDCSDRAKVVFNAAKLEGKNPTIEYGCKELNHNCHSWVLGEKGEIVCGGSKNFIDSFKYSRFSWNSVESAMKSGFH